MHKQVPLYINGEFISSSSKKYADVKNPATQETLSQVPFTPKRRDGKSG